MHDENKSGQPYIGRFAPSPTGALHFGSLVAAAGSWLQARSHRGEWLIRVEDIDPPREVPGATDEQLRTLARFGLESDRPVTCQSRFGERHEAALTRLLEAGLAFHCGCSRRELPTSGIYPGTCRNGLPPGREPRSVRLRTADAPELRFTDRIQGEIAEHPGRRAGDFVIRRGDGLIAYQLAVVVDDVAAGITEVVRGADLLSSTSSQMWLYRCLDLAPPAWMHLPVVTSAEGRKLSKSDAADPVTRHPPAHALRLALRALGHEPPGDVAGLDDQWQWALAHWDPVRIPRGPIPVGVHPR